MKFTLIVPNEKQGFSYKAAISEYQKRLSRYCKLNVILYDSLDHLEKIFPQNDYVAALHSAFPSVSSETLADHISQLAVYGKSKVVFLLMDTDRKLPSSIHIDKYLGLTSVDMPSSLALTLLHEQIYRSFRIINNQAYHK